MISSTMAIATTHSHWGGRLIGMRLASGVCDSLIISAAFCESEAGRGGGVKSEPDFDCRRPTLTMRPDSER